MRNIRRRYCCLNNNYMNLNSSNNCNKPDIIENACKNIECNQDYNENCSCGFDDDTMSNVFPENPMLGQSYVPIQTMGETFKPCVGLKNGTLFPELVNPYSPGDSMKEIKYLAATNTIGKGCNKCQ